MSEPLYYTTHDSVIGKLLLVAAGNGLRHVSLLAEQEEPETHFSESFYPLPSELPAFFATTKAAIDAYLAGNGPLRIPFHLHGGTPLQRAVWLALARIPYGETISYSTLAEKVGFPRAVRAVASACGANPLPLVIPCHRVVAKDGTLGGFSLGGLDVKDFLLRLERRNTGKAAA